VLPLLLLLCEVRKRSVRKGLSRLSINDMTSRMGNNVPFALSLLSSLLPAADAAGGGDGAASIWDVKKEAAAMAASAAGNQALDEEEEDAVDAARVVWSGGRAVE